MANIRQTLTYVFNNRTDIDDLSDTLEKFKNIGISYEKTSVGMLFNVDESNTDSDDNLQDKERKRRIKKIINMFTPYIDSLIGTLYIKNLNVVISILFNIYGKFLRKFELNEVAKAFVECEKCHKLYFQLATQYLMYRGEMPSECLHCNHLTHIPIIYDERIDRQHHYFIDCKTTDDQLNCLCFKPKHITQYLRMESNILHLQTFSLIEHQANRISNPGNHFSCYFKNANIEWENIIPQLTNNDIKNIIWTLILAVRMAHIGNISHLNISKACFRNDIKFPILTDFIYSERNLIIYDDDDLKYFYQSRKGINDNEYFSLLPEFKDKCFPIDPIKSDIFMLGKTIFDIINIVPSNRRISLLDDMTKIILPMISIDPKLRPSLDFLLDNSEQINIKKDNDYNCGPFSISEPKFIKKIMFRIMGTLSVKKGFNWEPKSYHLALNIVLFFVFKTPDCIQLIDNKIIIDKSFKKYIISASLFAYLYHHDIHINNLFEQFYEPNLKIIFKIISNIDNVIIFDTHYDVNDKSLASTDFINRMVTLYSK